MNKNYITWVGLAIGFVALLLSYIAISKPAQVVIQKNGITAGAISSPDINSSYLAVSSVRKWYGSQSLNQASTTVCSIQAPAATSTLINFTLGVDTGTTTSVAYEVAKDSSPSASTTRLAYTTAAAGPLAIHTGIVSTSTTAVLTATNPFIFAPNTYVNVKVGGYAGSANVLVGRCNAEFLQVTGY